MPADLPRTWIDRYEGGPQPESGHRVVVTLLSGIYAVGWYDHRLREWWVTVPGPDADRNPRAISVAPLQWCDCIPDGMLTECRG